MALQGRLPEKGADAPEAAGPVAMDGSAVADAHRSIRADGSIQFDLAQPPVPEPPPDWLLALLRWTSELGPVWETLFWVAIALAALILLVVLVPPLRRWAMELIRARRARRDEPEPAHWAPEATRARALIEEADALAAAGDYDAAVHLILLRSIEDIEAWRGDLVRPSLTARDIAAAPELPGEARGLFARIVGAVERSLFAGRKLSAQDWQRARDDYAGFALGSG